MTVNDPKGIADNINELSFEHQLAIQTRLNNSLDKARLARQYEYNAKQKESIKKWQDFFGDTFPDYTG